MSRLTFFVKRVEGDVNALVLALPAVKKNPYMPEMLPPHAA